MFGRWMDTRETVPWMSALEREMDQLFDLPGTARARRLGATLRDQGEALVLTVDLPGVAEPDVSLSIEGDVLSLAAERRTTTPEGHRAVRTERPQVRFARSFELPCRVDAETTTAALKDGVLTVTLPKAREARPRRIAIGQVS